MRGPGIVLRAAAIAAASPFVLAGALAAQTGFSCIKPPTVSPTLPVDTVITDQDDFNCFGWQEFIALNWKASPTQAVR